MGFVTGSPDHDFFDQNPELRYITEFKALIGEVGPSEASKIMWSIYMIEDPNSKIFRMPREDKVMEVKTNYFEDYDSKEYEDLSHQYGRYCLDKEEYLYNIQVEKLDSLTSHLRKLDIEKDKDFTRYLRIMDKLAKIWESLDKVKKKMIDKRNKADVRGGARRSAREKRN